MNANSVTNDPVDTHIRILETHFDMSMPLLAP